VLIDENAMLIPIMSHPSNSPITGLGPIIIPIIMGVHITNILGSSIYFSDAYVDIITHEFGSNSKLAFYFFIASCFLI